MHHTWIWALAGALFAAAMASEPAAAQVTLPVVKGGKWRVYFGTYSSGGSEGIYTAILDLDTGKLGEPALAGTAVNPSFLALHPVEPWLYSVGEVSELAGKKTGGVVAWKIDPATGLLTRLNEQPSGGAGPCHLVVDATGQAVLVANYSGGSVASLPLDGDGRLRPLASFIQHQGSSVNRARQEGPHAHSINLDANNQFAVAADLGTDDLFVYRFDPATAGLTPNDPPSAKVPPGGGPRHFVFHPNGQWAYANNELTSTVTALGYDADRGVLTPRETISTLPKGYPGAENTTAEIRVHPGGRWLYVSNRGHDSLAIFEIDASRGSLTPRGHVSTRGKVPRNFNIDPSGRYLLAANQDSDNVVVFRLDEATGQLEFTGSEIKVARPVCIRFLTIPGLK